MSLATSPADRTDDLAAPDPLARRAAPALLAVARIALGFVFLWAFLDKLLGLGYATSSEKAWVRGGSPTSRFLHGVVADDSENPFKGLFTFFLDLPLTDWLFMGGMAGVGLAFVLGVALRPAAIAAIPLLGMLYLAVQPLENNPVVDEHVIYLLTAFALAAYGAGDTWGLGRRWKSLPPVAERPFLY